MSFVRRLLDVLAGLLILTGAGRSLPAGEAGRPRVEIRTELGIMVVELYNETPQHRDNFLELVRQGRFDSLLWHRVIPAFMIQGGDPKIMSCLNTTRTTKRTGCRSSEKWTIKS